MNVDVVIVGAGSAGITLAARLTEQERRSVLGGGGGSRPPAPKTRLTASRRSVSPPPSRTGTPGSGDRRPNPRLSPGEVRRRWFVRQWRAGRPRVSRGLRRMGEIRLPVVELGPDLEPFRRLECGLDFASRTTVHGDHGPVPIIRWPPDELLTCSSPSGTDAWPRVCRGWTITTNHRRPVSGPLPDEPGRGQADVDGAYVPGPRSREGRPPPLDQIESDTAG